VLLLLQCTAAGLLLLQQYDPMQSSIDDYAEVAIQFGYTALFVTALPMAAFFGLISNVVEVSV
jgi:hypothetical protein